MVIVKVILQSIRWVLDPLLLHFQGLPSRHCMEKFQRPSSLEIGWGVQIRISVQARLLSGTQEMLAVVLRGRGRSDPETTLLTKASYITAHWRGNTPGAKSGAKRSKTDSKEQGRSTLI